MNEREADQADVRPFLPRPGEPVEEYAERLRAMHRDLSVVLQAVERGLQRAHDHAEVAEPPLPPVEVEPVPEPIRVASASREPSGAALRETVPGAPRVEVITTRTGHRADDPTVDAPWSEPDFVERRQPIEAPEPAASPDDPRWARATPAPPLPGRPSADPRYAEPQQALAERPSADPRYAEPQWTTPPAPATPTEPAPVEQRPVLLPQWAVAAILAGWLTIVALLLALLVEG